MLEDQYTGQNAGNGDPKVSGKRQRAHPEMNVRIDDCGKAAPQESVHARIRLLSTLVAKGMNQPKWASKERQTKTTSANTSAARPMRRSSGPSKSTPTRSHKPVLTDFSTPVKWSSG
jgi:hypothetical protein